MTLAPLERKLAWGQESFDVHAWLRELRQNLGQELPDGLQEVVDPTAVVESYARGDIAVECYVRIGSSLLGIHTRNLRIDLQLAGVHGSNSANDAVPRLRDLIPGVVGSEPDGLDRLVFVRVGKLLQGRKAMPRYSPFPMNVRLSFPDPGDIPAMNTGEIPCQGRVENLPTRTNREIDALASSGFQGVGGRLAPADECPGHMVQGAVEVVGHVAEHQAPAYGYRTDGGDLDREAVELRVILLASREGGISLGLYERGLDLSLELVGLRQRPSALEPRAPKQRLVGHALSSIHVREGAGDANHAEGYADPDRYAGRVRRQPRQASRSPEAAPEGVRPSGGKQAQGVGGTSPHRRAPGGRPPGGG